LTGAAAAAGPAPPTPDPDPGDAGLAAWLAGETDRLEVALEAEGIEADAAAALREALAGVRARTAAGRPWAALLPLQHAAEEVTGRASMARAPGASPALLDAEAARVAGALDGLPRGPAPRSLPLALAALVEISSGRAGTYREAADAYAAVTDLAGGLYYLAAAEANGRLAREVAGSGLTARRPRPGLAGLEAALERLDRDLGAAYADPKRAIEQHRRFIFASAAVKEARELLGAGRRAGAALTVLHGRLALTLAERGDGSRADADPVLAAARTWRARLDAAGVDPSLALVFLERAEHDASGEAPDEAAVRAARAIVDVVLPESLSLTEAP